MPNSPLLTLTNDQIIHQRDVRYRRTPERAVLSPAHARDFVNELGFCFFWPNKEIEMPSLFHAIAGRVRDVPNEHGDPDLSRCWGWKDNALGKRWWYYGKLLRRRATLISLDLLPVFYTASENFGDLTDYLDEYRDGLLTAEAKDIYEALLEHGPLRSSPSASQIPVGGTTALSMRSCNGITPRCPNARNLLDALRRRQS